jgi:fructose transport system substrate-binding protein
LSKHRRDVKEYAVPGTASIPRLVFATAGTAALALTVAACGSGAKGSSSSSGGSSKAATVKIALITKTDTNPFFVKMKEGATKEVAAKGAKLFTAAGKFDGDNATQVTAIENMVAQGVKGILLVPNDPKAIVPTVERARKRGVLVIALDTPTVPQTAVDALFATNNFKAGQLIGKYAKAAMKGKTPVIAMMDLNPGVTVGVLRHNGFLNGFGHSEITDADPTKSVTIPQIVCSQYTQGDQAKGQAAMENCIQKNGNINLVYSINEPSGLGAYTALQRAGKKALVVSVDGGCTGVNGVKAGKIAATSQQYPLKMAKLGVDAVVNYAKTGKKPSGYTDTGVNLITAKALPGVPSKDVQFGLANCWG